jgi:hypothetical protein
MATYTKLLKITNHLWVAYGNLYIGNEHFLSNCVMPCNNQGLGSLV